MTRCKMGLSHHRTRRTGKCDLAVMSLNTVDLPNLLAAGGAARGVSGNAVWGYLSGNGLLSAVAGGSIAAQAAIQVLNTP